jgi:hypothetical protein
MMRKLLPFYPSGTMNAAAADTGAPAADHQLKMKKLPARRASQEALRRVSFVFSMIFMDRV